MAAVNWETVENALQLAVRTATGLAGTSVFWAAQNVGRPSSSASFVTMILIDNGSDNTLYDDMEIVDNPTPSAGQEILFRSHVQRECTLRLNFFSPSVIGNSSARALAAKVHTYLSHDLALETLNNSGVAVFDRGNVETLPDVFEEGWEGRAFLDVMVRFMDGVDIPETYIQTVEFAGTYVP